MKALLRCWPSPTCNIAQAVLPLQIDLKSYRRAIQKDGTEQKNSCSPAGLDPLTGRGLVLGVGVVPGGQRLQEAAQ